MKGKAKGRRLTFGMLLLAAACSACGGGTSNGKPPLEPSNDALPSDDGGVAADPADAAAPLAETSPDGGALEQLPAPPVTATPVEQKGDEDGAQTFLKQFVAANADYPTLTKSLRPTTADYKAMFVGATASKVETAQAKDWNKAVIKPARPGQTEVKVWSATGADLAAGRGNAKEFPEPYKKFGRHLAPTMTFWRFKFVEPGKDAGTAYDGLAFTNGHWVIAPKPWRALEKSAADEDDKPKKKKRKR